MKSKRRGFSLIWVVLMLPLFFGVGSMLYAEMDAYERLVETSNRYWKLQIAANMAIKQGEVWLLQEVGLVDAVDARIWGASGLSSDLELVINGNKVPPYTELLPLISVDMRIYATDYPAGYLGLGSGTTPIPRIPSVVYTTVISSSDIERIEAKRYYLIRSIAYPVNDPRRKLILEKCIALSLDHVAPEKKLQLVYFKHSRK